MKVAARITCLVAVNGLSLTVDASRSTCLLDFQTNAIGASCHQVCWFFDAILLFAQLVMQINKYSSIKTEGYQKRL